MQWSLRHVDRKKTDERSDALTRGSMVMNRLKAAQLGFKCPYCRETLEKSGASYACENRRCPNNRFDASIRKKVASQLNRLAKRKR